MSGAPSGWQTPKTDWQAQDGVQSGDMNRIEGNQFATETGTRTLDQTSVPTSHTGTIRQIVSWFANRIKAITGKTNWYDAPATTLEETKTHYDLKTGIHGVGSQYLAKTSRSDQLTSYTNLTDKPSEFPPQAHQSSHAYGGTDQLINLSKLQIRGIEVIDMNRRCNVDWLQSIHNTKSLGTSAVRWKNGYFQGPIETADQIIAQGQIKSNRNMIQLGDAYVPRMPMSRKLEDVYTLTYPDTHEVMISPSSGFKSLFPVQLEFQSENFSGQEIWGHCYISFDGVEELMDGIGVIITSNTIRSFSTIELIDQLGTKTSKRMDYIRIGYSISTGTSAKLTTRFRGYQF